MTQAAALPGADRVTAVARLDALCQSSADGRRQSVSLAAISRKFGLSGTLFELLWLLHRSSQAVLQTASGPLDQKTIAGRIGISAAQVSCLVDSAQKAALVQGDRSPTDRRRQIWSLAPGGRAVIEQIVEDAEDWLPTTQTKNTSDGRPASRSAGFAAGSNRTMGVSQGQKTPTPNLSSEDGGGGIGLHNGTPEDVGAGIRTCSTSPIGRAGAAILGMAMMLSLGSGCSRSFYRQKADMEVYQMVAETAASGCVESEPFSIEIDPASRMFDPNDPDCPPMPPDDPASHRYMDCVDCKKGSPCWRHADRTPVVENPAWLTYLPRDDEGRVVLDLRSAVETALRQSPDYQDQREELYLSALDVTFERFRFDTQFFGGTSIFFTSDGENRSGLGVPTSTLEVQPLRSGNRLRAEKLTATGADLVVGLANSLVWQFSGPNDYAGTTLIDFAIVQPLLRAGGRTRVLERLTIAERALLANVRQMERFRRGFFTEVASGRNAGAGPSRRGGFFGGSGLEGFSGVGGGGFGRVGRNRGFAGGTGAADAGGFIGLLQDLQEIRNQEANVAALGDSAAQLEASYEASRIDRFQVDLARQALINAQSQLLTRKAQFQSSLDGVKVDYGLPPDLEVRIDDPMLDRFTLLDPSISELQNDVAAMLTATRQADRASDSEPDFPVEIGELARRSQEQLARAFEDFQRLEAALPERRETLRQLSGRDEIQSGFVAQEPFDVGRLDERAEKLREQLIRLDDRLSATWAELEAIEQSASDAPGGHDGATVAALTKLSRELAELALAQALARLDAITLRPIELTSQDALQIARSNRRDWMNARASLVDSWRLIAFNANDLLSTLDLTFSGDVSNVGDNPFDLSDTTGRLRVGLEFDAPLTRLSERNVYRQSLIEYQQARREYYQFVDRVSQGLRNTLRTIRLNEINFELRREAILVAVAQVDLTQLRLTQPPRPGETSQFGDTTARDLVQALGELLVVQNDFLSVWVNYEVQRMNLDFDLGTMQLDPNGVWLDHGMPFVAFLPVACETDEIGGLLLYPESETIEPEAIPAPPEEILPPDAS